MNQPAGEVPAIPPDALLRFTAAEARLYPLALVDPEAYERGVALTGTLLADLRSTCFDINAVLERRAALLRLLAEPEKGGGPDRVGFSPDTLVDAASALRCREIQSDAHCP